jgi:hypothetical protein
MRLLASPSTFAIDTGLPHLPPSIRTSWRAGGRACAPESGSGLSYPTASLGAFELVESKIAPDGGFRMIRLVRLLRKLVGSLREKPMAVAEFALIVAIVATVAGDFAFAAGWVTPGRIATLMVIEALEMHGGHHPNSVTARARGRAVGHNFMQGRSPAYQSTAKPLADSF